MTETTDGHYVAIDNETGGFEGTSLLSTYLEVFDKDFNSLGSLNMNVCPNDRIYHVEAGGLSVNKIDLVEHDKNAITYSQAGKLLRDYLMAWSLGGKNKLIPVGHGVTFDVIGLWVLLSRPNFEMYTSYRKIDTAVVAQFLKFCGKIPETVSGSLDSLCEHFNVNAVTAIPHTAKGDVWRTLAVLHAMRALTNNWTVKL